MTSLEHILLLEALDGSSDRLAEDMMRWGVEPVLVCDFEEAHEILQQGRIAPLAMAIPTDVPTRGLKREIKRLSRAGSIDDIVFLSTGAEPTEKIRGKLRSAGVTLAIWEPYDDLIMRHQLNRALSRDLADRKSERVPAALPARVFTGDREKEGLIYSLSTRGTFIETARASMDGARLELEIDLPEETVRVKGEVVFANVPGNLQRPNLPLGMGVEFAEGIAERVSAINRFVEVGLRRLHV